MQVAKILTDKGNRVVTMPPDTTLLEASRTLCTHKIGAVIVASDTGDVAGIMSERDIIKAIGTYGQDALARPVSAFMTSQVITCRESDTVDHVMELMTSGRFRHMPVTNNDALCGIVSIGDVVKHHIAEVEMEATALKTYLVAG